MSNQIKPKVIARHSFYGCDTGCCGWEICSFEEGKEASSMYEREDWTFSHSYNDTKEDKEKTMDFLKKEFPKFDIVDVDDWGWWCD